MDQLRTLVEGPAPVSTTTLDTVVRRGRRRVWARQAGTGLGVLAVVGVVGAGMMVLRPASPDRIETATPQTTVDWPRIDARSQVPPTTFQPGMSAPLPPGRTLVDATSCYQLVPETRTKSGPGKADLTPQSRQAFAEAARVVAQPAEVGDLIQDNSRAAATKLPFDGYYRYDADVTDSHGTGSVSIMAGIFTGDPVKAADERAFDLSNCEPPQRKVLPDGTVLQLYSLQASEPFQSLSRSVYVFRPGGKLYEVRMQNWGSPDFAPNPVQAQYPYRIGAGRHTLPLTEVQLAGIAERIALFG